MVFSALKVTPVVKVRLDHTGDWVAGNREFITRDDDTVLAAACSDPTGFMRALDRTTVTKYSDFPTFLRAIRSQSMMSAGSAGFC